MRVRACGWSLGSSGEAPCWVEQVVPLFIDAKPEIVQQLLEAAEARRKKLSYALRAILKTQEKIYTSRLYADTENQFYNHVRDNTDEGWDRLLRKESIKIFDGAAETYKCDPYKVAEVRQRL